MTSRSPLVLYVVPYTQAPLFHMLQHHKSIAHFQHYNDVCIIIGLSIWLRFRRNHAVPLTAISGLAIPDNVLSQPDMNNV